MNRNPAVTRQLQVNLFPSESMKLDLSAEEELWSQKIELTILDNM